jgi:hypothetical protein
MPCRSIQDIIRQIQDTHTWKPDQLNDIITAANQLCPNSVATYYGDSPSMLLKLVVFAFIADFIVDHDLYAALQMSLLFGFLVILMAKVKETQYATVLPAGQTSGGTQYIPGCTSDADCKAHINFDTCTSPSPPGKCVDLPNWAGKGKGCEYDLTQQSYLTCRTFGECPNESVCTQGCCVPNTYIT